MSSFTFFQILFFMFWGAPDHWTLHHVGTADKSHIKNDDNNFWTMCVTHEAKWMGTASMLMSSKIILRDILMIMKWHRNEKQTAPFHPDELTGALTETPGVDGPRRTGGEATVLPTPAPQTLFIRTLVFSHKKSLIPCTNAPMNIKFWQLPRPLKDLSLKRSDFLRPAAGTWTVLWVDVCQVPCQVQCL